jgi:2-polyprenyl-6-hydroxyphenyl methylase/3-demethylubiquinone-9 3-methyltransferase
MQRLGYEVLGVDASKSGIRIAGQAHPACKFVVGSVYDDLAAQHGRFPLVVSLEVIEHLYSPRSFCETFWDLLEPEGVGVISTPYHGYWKNLVLALTNRLEAHFDPLWEGGHIKFWSERSLACLLARQGFCDLTFRRAGRIPALAKSMVVAFRRPAAPDLKSESL